MIRLTAQLQVARPSAELATAKVGEDEAKKRKGTTRPIFAQRDFLSVRKGDHLFMMYS